MDTIKSLKKLSLITVIVLNITMILIFFFFKINYVPKEEINHVQSKLDSLLSIKTKIEKRLDEYQSFEKENRSKQTQNQKMKKAIRELEKHILNYQSQMRSLMLENEKLEMKIQRLESHK